MIAPMKRLTLLCLAAEREATVDAVRDLGVVHVVATQPPEGERLEQIRAAIARAERALSLLRVTAKHAPSKAEKDAVDRPADALVAEVLGLDALQREQEEEASVHEHALATYAPFGDFDPSVLRRLAGANVHIRLGVAAGTKPFAAPDEYVLREFSHDRSGRALCVVGRAPFELEELDLGAPVTAIPTPERSPSETRARLAAAKEAAARAGADLASLAPAAPVVEARLAELTDAARFASVRDGMGEAQAIAYLEGYVPAEAAAAVRQAAADGGWGVVFSDPDPDEQVPTLLTYSSLVRPIRALFDMLRIYPGYREPDVGWVFLPFFSLFFGMLVGDVFYGALVLATTAVLNRKTRRVPQYLFNLMYLTGGATLVWGVLTGRYLGISHLPSFLTSLQVGWLNNRENVIELCFVIGASHLTVAHLWNIVSVRPRTKILAQIGWIIDIWSMFFLARTMVLGHPFPSWGMYTLLGGIALVAAFMTTPAELKTQWINHALLILTIIGSFVDVLSYLRLFAVGYAGVAVIDAFNMMAGSFGWGNPLTAVFAVLVLVFANVLNLALCALGVLVHAVRLNTLEFSQHKGISWQGFLYEPFANRKPAADET
jgi:V/A-type H+-transporting ATPase subunit I